MIVWKVEFQKYLLFFSAIFGVELIIDILTILGLLSADGTIDTVHLFWQMLSWVAIVAFVIYNCFCFFVLGKDRFLHLLPYSKGKILFMKAAVFTCYMLTYFFMQLIRYLFVLPSHLAKSKFLLAGIYTGSKIVSIISFFLVLYAIISLVKLLNDKVLSGLVFALLFALIIGIQGVTLYNYLSQNQPMDWIIGIVEGMKGMNQYINIIPINFVPTNGQVAYVEATFNIMSVIMNTTISTVCFLVCSITYKKCKYNYIEI